MRTELFIAIDLSIRTVERLAARRGPIDRALPEGVEIRWVDPDHIHLALSYLGKVDDALIGMLRAQLDKLTRPLFPFQIECNALGAYPSLTLPRIIHATFAPEGAEVLGLLHRAMEKELAELGLHTIERPFLPYVTLGRVRSVGPISFEEVLLDDQNGSFGVSTIKNLVLFRVDTDQRGAKYTVVDRFYLGEM